MMEALVAATRSHRSDWERFMRVRRPRPGRLATAWAVGLISLVSIGCQDQEELPLDPGVSPFYPGPTASAGSTEGPAGAGGPPAEGPAAGAPASRAAPNPAVLPASESPLRPDDVERQLRIALRAAERGDSTRAVALLDRILALEPLNREALLGRSSLALA